MHRLFFVPLLLSTTAAIAQAYTGPCDIGVACAEAWSVDYATTNAYTGALFQLGLVSNPNSTLDVGCAGATVRGTCAGSTTFKADMTTWSTFCGGVANNCFVKKIYAQIHRHPNDLAFDPSAHPGRALFSIDSTTRLPLLDSQQSIGGQGSFDVQGTDAMLTGIPGGKNSVSILYLGGDPQLISTGGPFGLSHAISTPYINGSNFYAALAYGWYNGGGAGVNTDCATPTSFCMGAEEESTDDLADYSSTIPLGNVFIATIFNQSTNTVSGFINGYDLFDWSPPASQVLANQPLNPGNHLHLGMGGDGTQPVPFLFRGALIFNSPLTFAQYQAVFSNVQSHYPTLTFPNPSPAIPSGTYFTQARCNADIALLNGGLNISAPGDAHGTKVSCVANTAKSSSKWYYTETPSPVGWSNGVGVANSSWSTAFGTDTNAVAYVLTNDGYTMGNIQFGQNNHSSSMTYTSGKTIGVAVNLDTNPEQIWVTPDITSSTGCGGGPLWNGDANSSPTVHGHCGGPGTGFPFALTGVYPAWLGQGYRSPPSKSTFSFTDNPMLDAWIGGVGNYQPWNSH